MDRRDFLRGLGLVGCSAAAHPLLSTVTLAGSDGGRPLGDHRLVVMILRGAMDGLDVVQPQGDPDYAGLRPTLLNGQASDLDGFFRLHPALSDLMPLWRAGQLGFVHATSTPYRDKRSHFVGQDLLEAGTGADLPDYRQRDGWLNRLLQGQTGLTSETAYAIGSEALPVLAGKADVRNWSPETDLPLTPQSQLLLERIYADDPLFHAAAAEALELADLGQSKSMSGAVKGPVMLADIDSVVDYAAARLRQDTRIAAFSITGWDTHRNQSASLPRNLMRLQHAILQLQGGLRTEAWGKTVVLAMTEFGRTARENGTAGTDHGTAGAMVMAGGALAGGKVFGAWPGLSEADLYARRDLMPTSDVRLWIAQMLRELYGMPRNTLETIVFPGLILEVTQKLLL